MLKYLETLQSVHKLSKVSKIPSKVSSYFPDIYETVKTEQKPEIFQIVQKLSGDFPGHPKTVKSVKSWNSIKPTLLFLVFNFELTYCLNLQENLSWL